MSGKDVVASMVVFTNGVSDRSNYRKFKMSHERNDDTANMRETLTRRFSERNVKAWGLPDLILIDGGKGQLNAAIESLALSAVNVAVVSIAKREEELIIAKGRSHIDEKYIKRLLDDPIAGVGVIDSSGYYFVNLHVSRPNAGGHSRNLRGGDDIGPYDELTKLFQRIRDESHRFAISYHSSLKRKGATRSQLDDIPGVGPATRKKLLRSFGSVRGLSQASYEELRQVVSPSLAGKIKAHLSTEN
jgi:excinuclease ABC subunit C